MTRKTRCLVGTDAGTYTFSAAAKTITFSTGLVADIADVLLVTNVVDNIVIYQFNVVGKGATLTGNVLTLAYDTTTMSDTDELQIWVIAEPDLALWVTNGRENETISYLRKISSATQTPNWLDQSTASIRVVTASGVTLTTLISGGSTTSAQDQMFRDQQQSKINYALWHKSFSY